MIRFFTAAHVATTALIGIERLIDPSEFGSNLFNAGAGPTHAAAARFSVTLNPSVLSPALMAA